MKTDVVIVGAGVIGLAIAHELLSQGTRVTLVDQGEPGRGASWASAGVLAPQGALPWYRPYLDLCLASRDLFADWSAHLLEETGIDVEYRTDGGLQVAFDDEESEELVQRYRHQQELGLPVERLTAQEVRALEPMLSPETRSGLLFEGMHQVENRRLVQALVAAVKGRGGEFRIGNPVIDLINRRNRAAGVVLPGERIGAGRVVIAAGAWSGLLNWIPGQPPPVQPVRGQIVCVDGSGLTPLRRVIYGLGQYLVPRRDGRVLLGATVEKAGFDATVTAGGLSAVMKEGLRMAPGLAGAPVVETWAGLRPMSKDGKPILGPSNLERLVLATGHYRNGILLAPVTGRLIADYLSTGAVPTAMAPFLLDRFNRKAAQTDTEERHTSEARTESKE